VALPNHFWNFFIRNTNNAIHQWIFPGKTIIMNNKQFNLLIRSILVQHGRCFYPVLWESVGYSNAVIKSRAKERCRSGLYDIGEKLDGNKVLVVGNSGFLHFTKS